MKKIKVSELPLFSSLRGLFTIGTDANNRSVKVSLEFIEDETSKAVQNAETATANAITATNASNSQTALCKTATDAANASKSLCDTATSKANAATSAANTARDAANTATSNANQAATSANNAKTACQNATAECESATSESRTATADAVSATQQTHLALGQYIPTGLEAKCIQRITYGNPSIVRIDIRLLPETAMRNVICISDNRAVSVTPDGQVRAIAKGRSVVHVVPTTNTALAKSLLIEVGDPTLRFASKNRKAFRLTSAGSLRLN